MKHKLFLLFLSVTILLGLSMTASAGTYTLKLISYSSTPGDPAVGAYKATLTYGTIKENVNIICDDYSDDVNIGETWQVKENNIDSLSNVLYKPGHFFYKGDSQTQAYAEALWIADYMLTHPKLSASTIIADQWAIWALFTPMTTGELNSEGATPVLAGAQSWWTGTCDPNAAAEKACLAGLADLVIFTPVPGTQIPRGFGPPQEFIGTPEPASMLLLGSFLSLAGGLLSKKTRRS